MVLRTRISHERKRRLSQMLSYHIVKASVCLRSSDGCQETQQRWPCLWVFLLGAAQHFRSVIDGSRRGARNESKDPALTGAAADT